MPEPFYLQGNFAPVTEEVTAFDLPVDGTIPESLRGRFVRNGPNAASGDPGHWFLGDGMLHGVALRDRNASWYRNRWVKTRVLAGDGEFVDAERNIDRSAGA